MNYYFLKLYFFNFIFYFSIIISVQCRRVVSCFSMEFKTKSKEVPGDSEMSRQHLFKYPRNFEGRIFSLLYNEFNIFILIQSSNAFLKKIKSVCNAFKSSLLERQETSFIVVIQKMKTCSLNIPLFFIWMRFSNFRVWFRYLYNFSEENKCINTWGSGNNQVTELKNSQYMNSHWLCTPIRKHV